MPQTVRPDMLGDFANQANQRRLQDLTGNYCHLQGLRIVPFGLFFLAYAVFLNGRMEDWALLAALGGAMGLFFVIGLYYKRTFGRVRRRLSHQVRDGVVVTLFLVLVVGGIRLESRFDLPVSTIGLAIAGIFFYLYAASRGYRRHYLAVAVGFALLSFLPLLGLLTSGEIFGRGSVVGKLALGVTYILIGIFDHLYLVKNFKPIPQETDADTV